jgi:hypothetical protein
MNYSTLLRRYAGWGLALGVMVACGTQDNTPPSSYGYPEDGGTTPVVTNAAGSSTSAAMPADSSGNSGSSSGDQTQTPPPSSTGTGSGGVCPSSCKANADCTPCGLPPGSTGKNCCVMGICAMMASCPVIRDSGRDGS